MTKGDVDRFRVATYVVAVASLVAFWSSYLVEKAYRSAWGEVVIESQRPPLLNGLRFRLDRFVEPAVLPGRAERYLVIVLSDQCRFSAEDMPRWTTLLRTLPFRETDEILLISTSGRSAADELAKVAADRSVRTQRLDVVQRAGFSHQSGIAWTPATVVLDHEMRVRLASERVTDVFEALIAQAYGQM